MTASFADYEWLTSAAAEPYLARCAEFSGELTRLVTALRKDLPAPRAHLVIEQIDLRRRAQEKFARASEMFFTRKGFEQATDEVVAAYKAQRFRDARGVLVDICCGIGGDLLALAQGGESRRVYGIDLDPISAHLAAENCRRAPNCQAMVLTNDAHDILPAELAGWHVDPDRRVEGRRTTTLETFSPSLALLNTWAAVGRGGVKLAPATPVPDDWQAMAEREWIGSRGECRQQMVWFAPLGTPGKCAATIVDAHRPVRQVIENELAVLEMAAAPDAYVFESHAAVLAAGLGASLAAEHDLRGLTPEGAYLTGPRAIQDLALAAFEVLDVLPLDTKQLKAYLRERGIGRLEVKKRGIDDDPERLRKQLLTGGDNTATLLLYRGPNKRMAVVARRLAN